MTEDFIDWRGQSGTLYRYWFCEMAQPLNAVAGNYTFVKRLPHGHYTPLYFGETNDCSDRIPNHELWNAAVMLGATHVMAHSTLGGVAARRTEERDLIAFWNPPLNVQYRTTG